LIAESLIADCGLRIADCGFSSSIRNPPSAIRNQMFCHHRVFLNRSTQDWDAFSPRRNEENEGSEEKAINWLSSRPSLSSLLRGEKPVSQSPLV
jgi:hypothetical protein